MVLPEITAEIAAAAPNRSVVAAAGCGKTETIAKIVSLVVGRRALVLTHTNAGRAVLTSRLLSKGCSTNSFRVETLDGWALKLASAFPLRSQFVPAADATINYTQVRRCAGALLKSGDVEAVLRANYSRVLVDEYQDCTLSQHAIVTHISTVLPTTVFGDPLQGIFDFGDGSEAAVPWSKVENTFPPLGELTTPWRWLSEPPSSLGKWLRAVRGRLVNKQRIDLRDAHPDVRWIEPSGTAEEIRRRQIVEATRNRGAGQSLLVFGESTSPHRQREFARSARGLRVVESISIPDLMRWAARFDRYPDNLVQATLDFAASVMSGVRKADLLKRVETIRRGKNRKQSTALEQAVIRLSDTTSASGVLGVLEHLALEPDVRVFAFDLFESMRRVCGSVRGGTFSSAASVVLRQRQRVPRRDASVDTPNPAICGHLKTGH